MSRLAARAVSGVLLLDKPQGLSSNQALQKVKRLLRASKAGHTGSLDPLATGMLPICLGEATKIAGLLLGAGKAYVAEALLGVTTTTDDAEGEVLLRREFSRLDEAAVKEALGAFRGRIRQVPPIYSALKRDGVPLYKRARRGEEVTPQAREVEVHRFELVELTGARLRLHVECGSGTYVRSLVRDLGEALGCGAHVSALRRLWVAPFAGLSMHTLEELERVAVGPDPTMLDALLLPLRRALSGFPTVEVSAEQAASLRHGRAVAWRGVSGAVLVVDPAGSAVALAQVDDGFLHVRRGFGAD